MSNYVDGVSSRLLRRLTLAVLLLGPVCLAGCVASRHSAGIRKQWSEWQAVAGSKRVTLADAVPTGDFKILAIQRIPPRKLQVEVEALFERSRTITEEYLRTGRSSCTPGDSQGAQKALETLEAVLILPRVIDSLITTASGHKDSNSCAFQMDHTETRTKPTTERIPADPRRSRTSISFQFPTMDTARQMVETDANGVGTLVLGQEHRSNEKREQETVIIISVQGETRKYPISYEDMRKLFYDKR